jgi:sphingomyelin phosphodiesterase
VQENPVSVEMLHITDMHWDPEYVEGSESNCNTPLCCRKESTAIPTKPMLTSGKWGDHKCDTPMEAIIEMFAEIRTRHSVNEPVLCSSIKLLH